MPARLINEIKLSKLGNYQLWQSDKEGMPYLRMDLKPDTPEYFQWLASLPSFRFVGKEGHFTARKETRQRGEMYWYAYRRQGKQFSVYLGTTDKLTIARLEHIAGALAALCSSQEKKKTTRKRPVQRAALIARIADRDKTIEDLQAQLYQQEQVIGDLKKQIKMFDIAISPTPATRKQALPKPDEEAPTNFTYLSDFCAQHFIPYQAAVDLFPRAIRGQPIKVQGRNHPVIGPRGRHDFWVQLHTRPDFRACDDCPHEESGQSV